MNARKAPPREPDWVCPSCGASNAPRWRTCGRCGAARPSTVDRLAA